MVLQEKLGGVCGPLPKTCGFPYHINDQTKNCDIIFVTVAAGTVALNIIYEGLLLIVLSIKTTNKQKNNSRLEKRFLVCEWHITQLGILM